MRTLLMFLLFFQLPGSEICQWGKSREVGSLPDAIAESSGLAASRRFPGRLYHVNDSGDSGRFFITDESGGSLRTVRIAGYRPGDVEDLAVGPCDTRTDCLFIGDIGDNHRNRVEVGLAVIQEQQAFSDQVPVKYLVRMRYPDGAHDAESMAVHPNGTVFVLTKDLLGQSAGLYRLRPQQWKNAGGKAQTLEHVITLDLAKLLPGLLFLRRVPTAMDMSSDGKHLLVLMYVDAVEINLDFSAATIPPVSEWREGHTYRSIPIAQLQQQESVAYAPGGRAFFYTTERGSGRNPLMRVDCVRD